MKIKLDNLIGRFSPSKEYMLDKNGDLIKND